MKNNLNAIFKNKYFIAIRNLAICIIIYLVLQESLTTLAVYGFKHSHVFKELLINNGDFIVLVNDILSIPLVALLIKCTKKDKVLKYCKFNKVNPIAILVLSLIGVSVGLFSTSFIRMPFVVKSFPSLIMAFELTFEKNSLIVFVLFLIIGSIYKEMLFRGMIFNELKDICSFKVAIVLQGLFYGFLFFQLQIAPIAYSLLGSILFALLYTWFDSIWAPVAAQITSAGGLYLLSKIGGGFVNNYYYLLLIVSILGMIAGVYYLWRNKDNLKCEINMSNNNNAANIKV